MTDSDVIKVEKGAEEYRGVRAQLSILMGATALSDIVKTTLGPKGMDKILLRAGPGMQSEVEVTNDGATILKSIHVDNPAAKILVDISKTQDDEVGDGTTSVCVFAGELLREAERLLQDRIHPQTIITGYRRAKRLALEVLQRISVDHREDEEAFHADLMNMARTTISSKVIASEKEHFAKLAFDAALRIKSNLDLESIYILKKPGGTMGDSFLAEGFILDKEIGVGYGIGEAQRIEDAKVLVANTPMDTDKIKIYSAKVRTSSILDLATIEEAEQAKMFAKCKKIADYGCNVFVNRQLIYDFPMEAFINLGVMPIEHADFEGIERLSRVLGAEILSTFDAPNEDSLGRCRLIHEIMIGEDKVLHFSGCQREEACTIVVRGPSVHLVDEVERSLHDALCVLTTAMRDSRVVFGGGCSEAAMARAIEENAKKTPGKVALAMHAYSKALMQMPTIIADNAGLDAAELISALEAEHYNDNMTAGLDLDNSRIGDMREIGVLEPFRVKQQVVLSATEAAEMLLKVDEVIRTAPRPRHVDPRFPEHAEEEAQKDARVQAMKAAAGARY